MPRDALGGYTVGLPPAPLAAFPPERTRPSIVPDPGPLASR